MSSTDNDSVSPFDNLSMMDENPTQGTHKVLPPLNTLGEDSYLMITNLLEHMARLKDIASMSEKSEEIVGLVTNCESFVWDFLAKEAGFSSVKEALDNGISLSLKSGCFIYAEKK